MITIDVDAKKLEARINTIISDLKDSKKLLDKIGDELLEEYSEHVFEKQGTPTSKWAGMSAKTLRARASGWGYYAQSPVTSGKALVWTGRLKNGFKKVATAKQVTISNTTPYFKYHQGGGGKLPKRPMLHLDPPIQKKITDIVEKEIKAIVK